MKAKKVSVKLLAVARGIAMKEQEMNCSGIYCITNERNGHQYIGQTKSFKERKKEHFCLLRHGKHPNQYLQNSFKYHGGEWFTFSVIEVIEDYSQLDDREQYWIERTNPAYNIVRFVGGRPKKPRKNKEDYYDHYYFEETFTRPEWHKFVYGGSKHR